MPMLDRIDLAILDILKRDGRISFQALSERVHLTPRPCQARVRKLERMGVIRGYCALVDDSAARPGLSLLVLVALSSLGGRQAQRRFEALMQNCDEVIECRLISGAFDYSLRMQCSDMEHYRQLTETWLNHAEFEIDKLVSNPELSVLKHPYA
ncbi:Lrp/AsnC family transcriptional regulator [Larsenimonas salina]|uniref:Lrp/AsnC family transcriptional regulator n=1 Tax=Larsenimonas salina TaxID=1295565 RepID=UPI0020746ABE|nr:Lrp/AsnC family transcriptional regulator [Larsenimonas salina]MCM5703309.1 Lrp/AsnC family transcriptional regulator [Larsenimonas salina]